MKKCVHFIETNKKWNAKVIYGDTDSVFVKLTGFWYIFRLLGRSMKEAF